MAGSPLLRGPRAGGVGLLVLLLLGLFRPPPALCARLVKEPRGLSAASPPLAETGAPRRFRRSVPRGEAAGAVQELARALAHLLEAERQERARAEAQEAEDQQARVLAQMLRVWGAPRNSDPTLGLDDDPDAPAAQLARALLRARLDPAALAAQLVPAPVPAAALRSRPPVYDDGPAGPDAEDAGDETPDVDPELLRCPAGVGEGSGACVRGGLGRGTGTPASLVECEPLSPGALGERSWLHGIGARMPGPGGGDGERLTADTASLHCAASCRYLLGRILAGSADSEGVAAPRRFRRAADQDVGSEVPPEGVLGALLRVKRLETPAPQMPARRLLPP
uniref:Proprotein convertase subtilisin/kexin type 1 inhibitor n=1 Tax=Callithrix jacchus TaxID=9483 RepID=A0A5F4VWS0_CALJA